MIESALTYQIPEAAWSIAFLEPALVEFSNNVQRGRWSKESVGQLYTRDLTSDVIAVEAVTKLPIRWANFSGVRFDPAKAAAERLELFAKGFHFVGFWHSHPEAVPQPSDEDLRMAADHASAAKPVLSGLIFVVVGTQPPPEGVGVWVHDGISAWPTVPQLNKEKTLSTGLGVLGSK